MNDEMSDERKENDDVNNEMSETDKPYRLSIEFEGPYVDEDQTVYEAISRLMADPSEFDISDERYSLLTAEDEIEKYMATGRGIESVLADERTLGMAFLSAEEEARMKERLFGTGFRFPDLEERISETLGPVSAISNLMANNEIAKQFATLDSSVEKFNVLNLEAYKLPAIEKLGVRIREALDSIRPMHSAISAARGAANFSIESDLVRNLSVDVPPIYPPIDYISPTQRNEPIPEGGSLCFSFQVTGGTAGQVGNILNDEIGGWETSRCFLIEHDSDCYWHIAVFHGSDGEIDKLIEGKQEIDVYEWLIMYEALEEKVEKLGYVYVSDRPIVPIRFYTYDEVHKDAIVSLAHRIANELSQSGFNIRKEPEDFDTVPEGATVYDDFNPTQFEMTTDGLTGWIRSHLQAIGHIPESLRVEQKLIGDYVFIQYALSGTIIRFKTVVEMAGQVEVYPEILCWEANLLEYERSVVKAKQQIKNLLADMRKAVRWQPKKPKQSDSLDVWFDYYHECKEASIKLTFDDIGNEIGLAGTYVRQKHLDYKAERGI